MSYASELPTQALINMMLRDKKHCYIPVVQAPHKMIFVEYNASTATQKNHFGILEPKEHHPQAAINKLDLIILPLLAFDHHGNRLGAGKGFYDRALARAENPFLLGLAYASQEVEHIPNDVWDVRLDGVLTEKSLRIF